MRKALLIVTVLVVFLLQALPVMHLSGKSPAPEFTRVVDQKIFSALTWTKDGRVKGATFLWQGWCDIFKKCRWIGAHNSVPYRVDYRLED